MALADALQNILTKGLDTAASLYQAKLNAENPNGYVTGPNGQRTLIGGSGLSQTVQSIAPLLLVGGLVIVAAIAATRLLRK